MVRNINKYVNPSTMGAPVPAGHVQAAAHTHYIYDGSYEGFLSVVFYAYDNQMWPESITPVARCQTSLFGNSKAVQTNEQHADRVLSGVRKYMTIIGLGNLLKAFLSEEPGIELVLFAYIKETLTLKQSIEYNYGFAPALAIYEWVKKLNREVHRMHAFVRFQKTADGLYAATISPDFNVLPLLGPHFEKRYADQCWLIYDTKRKRGLYYDKYQTYEVIMENTLLKGQALSMDHSMFADEEHLFQRLWQQYFSSVNISERRNMRLHIKHVPKRYWRYLSEKQPMQKN